MVQLKKLFHNGNFQIGIYFGFDEELKNKAKSIGARWSQTHKCWYVLYNKENYKLIKLNFDGLEIVKDQNNERHTESAFIRHETVHIAEVISEIRPTEKTEHKGTDPEIAGQIVLTGSLGKYWILKVPYRKGITPKLMDIKGVYWNKRQKAFVLRPDWSFLFQSMKRKQKSCQNEPSAGRFDGPRARFDQRLTQIRMFNYS